MYSYLLMVSDYLRTHNLHWFMIVFLFIMIRWAVVFFTSLRYKEYVCENKDYFTSVIIPVVDEPLDMFTMVLTEMVKQTPNEIIVVVNGPENPQLLGLVENLQMTWKSHPDYSGVSLKLFYTTTPGKRNAVRIGVEESDPNSDITVLVDSDAIWVKDTLKNLLMPFSADEKIGGVTTRQKIYDPDRKFVTMVAGVLEEIRAEGTMKAMSVTGKVGCLPGRTIAFRTSILRSAMHEFMTEEFMGFHKEVSDDRSLTNITLKMGYKTVMQDSSVVYTDAPLSWKKFARQQLRWAEGSQYNNIRMTPWMLKNAKLMCYIYWCDMLMPLLLFSIYGNILLCTLVRSLGYHIDTLVYHDSLPVIAALIFVGSTVSLGSRNIRIFSHVSPDYILFLPVMVLVLTVFMAPIRVIGLMKCADSLGWGTRVIEEQKAEPEERKENHEN